MLVYKHSHFLPDAFGHGGSKRTAQIDEILSNAGITFQTADLANNFITKYKLSLYLKGLAYNKNLNAGNKTQYAIGRYLQLFEDFVKNNKPDLFLWESTAGYNLLLAEVLYKNNIPAIALPHNLESLAAGTKSVFSGKTSPNWLYEEVQYLNYCEKTFTISSEEQWLLSNMGINAAYLPYYPALACKKFLLKIRARKQQVERKSTDIKNVLLLGTFYNKPTADGYIELINNIKADKNLKINIAGYGSENLEGMFKDDNIKIWGSVSNEVLSKLIIDADYGIVHQQPSSGALTRVIELLLAGLPLFLNVHAARSHAGTPGIKIYNSYAELLHLVHATTPAVPPVLDNPAEEKYFADHLIACINKV